MTDLMGNALTYTEQQIIRSRDQLQQLVSDPSSPPAISSNVSAALAHLETLIADLGIELYKRKAPSSTAPTSSIPGTNGQLDPSAMMIAALDVHPTGLDTFIGGGPTGTSLPVFGGQLLAQAVMAATKSVSNDRIVHSVHGHFFRPGDPRVPLEYRVERVRDGQSFAARRVTVHQHGREVFAATISFQAHEQGPDHGAVMPDVAGPEELPTLRERYSGYEHLVPWISYPHPVDVRYVTRPPWLLSEGDARPQRTLVWLRSIRPAKSAPGLHAALLALASDLTLLDPVLIRHSMSWMDGKMSPASIDHALWIHRTPPLGEWLLYETQSPSASSSRGLATGTIWSREGKHIASTAQEGLFRAHRAGSSPGIGV